MTTRDGYSVSVEVTVPRAIAAVRLRLPPARIPTLFASYLNRVYAAGSSASLGLDGQNIFVYRDPPDAGGELDVEFGVGVAESFSPIGEIRYSELPTGTVATTTHWGDYGLLSGAHEAIVEWCRANGRTRAGPRWEVYGHWRPNEDPRTDVYYLLNP